MCRGPVDGRAVLSHVRGRGDVTENATGIRGVFVPCCHGATDKDHRRWVLCDPSPHLRDGSVVCSLVRTAGPGKTCARSGSRDIGVTKSHSEV